ncbi:MAG: hypothetical protein ACPHGV_03390 [Synechococcus sp.]
MNNTSFSENQNQRDRGDVTPGLQTCFVVAGFRGAGKSTIIRSCHDLDLRLFGERYHREFRDTGGVGSHEENDDYAIAIKIGANFQGRHIHALAKESSPPHSLMLQVDLKHVIHKLGFTAASKDDRRTIKAMTSIPTPLRSKADPDVCDLMVSSFLRNPFFRRFKTILVNTVYTDFDRNLRQFQFRKAAGAPLTFDEPSHFLRKAHQLVYTSWNKHLDLLNPEQVFSTTVNSAGDLISNDCCLCEGWRTKAGLSTL